MYKTYHITFETEPCPLCYWYSVIFLLIKSATSKELGFYIIQIIFPLLLDVSSKQTELLGY